MGVGALHLKGDALPAYGPAADGASTRRTSLLPRLIALSFVGLLVGQLGRLPVAAAGSKEAPLLASDVFVVLLLLVGLFEALRRRALELDRVSAAALIFVGVGGFSALLAGPRFSLSPFELAFSLAYLARWTAYFGLYLLVVNFVDGRRVEGVWRALELAVVVFAAFGIVQSALLPGFAQMVYPEAGLYTQWDPQGRRLVSTFLDPNLAGALLVMVLLVQGARLALGAEQPLWRTVVVALALLLTLSRSSWLAAAVGGLLLLVLLRRVTWRMVAGAGVIALLTAPVLPPLLRYAAELNKFSLDDPSLLARFVAYAQAWTVFGDHPLLGVGFNTYGFVQRRVYGSGELVVSSFGLDGGLIFIAVMTGLVGLAAFLALVVFALRVCVRAFTATAATAEERALGAGVAVATVALLVHSLFSNSLLYVFVMQAFWVLLGLAFVAGRRARTEGEPEARGAEAP